MLEVGILNGQVVTPHGIRHLDIGIRDGRIVTVAERGQLFEETRETVDATGLLVLPGIIDSHFHCRAPANPEREDFASGTHSAAAGGVTTVIEMPISVPPTTDGKSLAERRFHAERDAVVDVAFYSSPGTLDPAKIQSSVDEGAVAFKAFMQDVPVGREDEFTGICLYRNNDVMQALRLVGPTGLPAVFHAEDFDTLTFLGDELMNAGRKDIAAHWEWRPDYVEAIAVNTLCMLAEATGVHVHLPHISAALTVDTIRAAKDRGAPVTAETCPQYLLFDRETLKKHGPFAKCNPPFKTQDDIAALWEGLADGTIDTIATDHSPFTTEQKAVGLEDIWKAPPGIPGVEVLTPFALDAGLTGKLPLDRAIDLVTGAPASIFGISQQKGSLEPGVDADITLYDPSPESTVDISTWKCRTREIAKVWDGLKFQGAVVRTIVRGKTVFVDGEVTAGSGTAKIIRPDVATPDLGQAVEAAKTTS
jgi:allantoinase